MDNLISVMLCIPILSVLALMIAELVDRWLFSSPLPVVLWRLGGLLGSAATLVASLLLLEGFEPTRTGFQWVEYAAWIPTYGIHYFVGIDGINLWLVVLTTFLVPVALLATWNEIEQFAKGFVLSVLALETCVLGILVSINLFQFYLFWEAALVPMLFLLGIWGGPARVPAARKLWAVSGLGGLVMLLAILCLANLGFEQTGRITLDLAAPAWSDTPGLLDIEVPIAGGWPATQFWLFAAFAFAFAIRAPLVPLHGWLADANVEAPTAGAALLCAVVIKTGAYAFLRFALPLFPVAAIELSPWILHLATAGVLYGALLALVQNDLKRLIAYASLAHLGLVMVGVWSLELQGVNGSLVQMVSHGLSTAALLLLVGMWYERRQTRDIGDFGGVARPMPVYAFFFGFAALANVGVPLSSGFVGELLILIGAYLTSPVHALLAALGIVLALAGMGWLLRSLFFGPVEREQNRSLIDLGRRETAVLVALCLPVLWIGVYPDPMLRRTEPTVSALLQHVTVRYQALRAEPETEPATSHELELPFRTAARTDDGPGDEEVSVR